MTDTSKLQRYVCHKKVHAAEIVSVGSYFVDPKSKDTVRSVVLMNGATVTLPEKAFARATPQHGDFYVVYEDGYQSFSPRDAFLGGYKLVDDRTFRDIKAGTNLRDLPAGTNA